MNHTPEALQLANQLEANYAHVYAGLAPAAAAALRSQHARIADLEAENNGLRILASGGMELFERYSTFKAKCEELEAMLDAVGAGGVGQSIKPQIQADTAQAQQEPVAWICAEWSGSGVPELSFDGPPQELSVRDELTRPVWTPLYTAPQPTENLRCKSTQKRLATLWGYVKKEPDHLRDAAQMVPARQPLTDEKLYALYCEAMKGYYISSLHHWRDAEAHKFARAIEAAVANQPPRQPLTDSQVKELLTSSPP